MANVRQQSQYGQELQNRLIDFTVSVLKLTSELPKSHPARAVATQLNRSGMSPSLNYAEARSAESDRDFLHKMKVCLKELRESHVALTIIHRMEYMCKDEVASVAGECNELIAIFVSSINKRQKRLMSK